MNGKQYATCTEWTVTQPETEGNDVICSKMDGPGDVHTKSSESGRERHE